MKTFHQFMTSKNEVSRFVNWVLEEGVYLSEQELHENLFDKIKSWFKRKPAAAPRPEDKEGYFPMPKRSDYETGKEGDFSYKLDTLRKAKRKTYHKSMDDPGVRYINDLGNEKSLGGRTDSQGKQLPLGHPEMYGYRQETDDDDVGKVVTKRYGPASGQLAQKDYDKFSTMRNTVLSIKKAASTLKNINPIVRDAITAMENLMKTSPRLRNTLQNIVDIMHQVAQSPEALNQVFSDIQKQHALRTASVGSLGDVGGVKMGGGEERAWPTNARAERRSDWNTPGRMGVDKDGRAVDPDYKAAHDAPWMRADPTSNPFEDEANARKAQQRKEAEAIAKRKAQYAQWDAEDAAETNKRSA